MVLFPCPVSRVARSGEKAVRNVLDVRARTQTQAPSNHLGLYLHIYPGYPLLIIPTSRETGPYILLLPPQTAVTFESTVGPTWPGFDRIRTLVILCVHVDNQTISRIGTRRPGDSL